MNYKEIIKRILIEKKIIVITIGLSFLVIFIFVFKFPKLTRGDSLDLLKNNFDEFVIKSAEEEIQPVLLDKKENEIKVVAEDGVSNDKCNLYNIYSTSSDNLDLRKIKIPILTYHYIEATPAGSDLPNLFHNTDIFEAQLKSLKDACYDTIFVSEAGEAIVNGQPLPAKPLAITFDDGYADMYYNAWPLLKKYGMKGTMYVIVEALDKPGYLTSSQAREMSESGYVEIASHTLNHVNLFKTDYQKAGREIIDSRKKLEQIIGQPVKSFAYPYGFFTVKDERLCQQAGYLTCASTYPGDIQSLAKRYSLYRLRPGQRIGQSLISWLEGFGPKR